MASGSPSPVKRLPAPYSAADDPLSSPRPPSFKRRAPASNGLLSAFFASNPFRSSSPSVLPSSQIDSQQAFAMEEQRDDVSTGSSHTPKRSLPPEEPPKIPTVIPSVPQHATPLPGLPLLVLCFAMLSEFLSASVAGPFIFFFLEDVGVGQGQNGGGEAAVGFWAGIVGSSFFFTQFLTSLLWASMSSKYGRRAILFTSLLGNGLSLAMFGMSKSLGRMLCLRLAQGIFNGAIGVARGAVRDITDTTNENAAMSWMGVCWGMGGIVGPILGGLLEHPAENYPSVFGKNEFLRQYPYVLPCWIASSVTLIGACLSLFLGYDGGLREGAIRLQEEKQYKSSAVTGINKADIKSINKSRSSLQVGDDSSPAPMTSSHNLALPPSSSSRPISSRRQSTSVGQGNSYGYEPQSVRSNRRSSTRSFQRRASMARSTGRSPGLESQCSQGIHDHNVELQPLNFAQRLLLSHEDAVFGLHDVWLAAATAQDRGDDEYSQADPAEWMGSVFDDDDSRLDREGGIEEEDDQFGYDGSDPPSLEDLRGKSASSPLPDPVARPASKSSDVFKVKSRPQDLRSHQQSLSSHSRIEQSAPFFSGSYAAASRFPRPSISSQRPAIFNNTGLATPPMMSPSVLPTGNDEPSYFEQGTGPTTTTGQGATLAVIPETRPASYTETLKPPLISSGSTPNPNVAAVESQIAPQSMSNLLSMLPLPIIAQYAVLAFHGTTCDQVFMSLLVTPIASGGLGLSASHFAELIAAMCVVQVVAQFRFYPNFGPPRGSWSHISMFRLGLGLYIPVYLLFPELRGLLREDHNRLVMFGMILLSTFRWVANVCAYTAVMVLINAQTPPHLVSLANGLAQSAVSMARFLGPVMGGIIWSFSITPSPDARPYPFNNALGFVTVALISFMGLLTSFRLK